MLVIWSDDAYNDLNEILDYFGSICEEALGRRIVQNLFNATNILAEFPESGRLGRINGTRELINKTFPYITVYTITSNNKVDVLGVIHTSRQFQTIFD
ncbi:MAG: type II toxin-antitoxin system RelE/ParE family toxin [Deferribacteraceae bacterium]|nr:type II toxin-antitoxin system RelE/ParE family toxin [Deferribacteraceae bacterium]